MDVLPAVTDIARRHPARTLFTRFIPARKLGGGPGVWRKYYEKWPQVTLEREGAALIELHPALSALVPPALVLDKPVYSPWAEGGMDQLLGGTGIDTLVITGGETDVCVRRRCWGASTEAIVGSS